MGVSKNYYKHMYIHAYLYRYTGVDEKRNKLGKPNRVPSPESQVCAGPKELFSGIGKLAKIGNRGPIKGTP
jgi:hypothetical protein